MIGFAQFLNQICCFEILSKTLETCTFIGYQFQMKNIEYIIKLFL